MVQQLKRILKLLTIRNRSLPRKKEFGYLGKNVVLHTPLIITQPSNVFLHDNTNIFGYSKIIIATSTFTMKQNSGAAQGLTVVTDNHGWTVGAFFKSLGDTCNRGKDIIVEEDVWLGTNVTLLPGVVVGRGAVVGAGAVCRNCIPPYAIVIGNPAKVVGFKFTPEEIIRHESQLYSEHERLPYDLVERNYDKYYIQRITEIKKILK